MGTSIDAADLLTQPPPEVALTRIEAIPGVVRRPTVLVSQTGPDSHLGPESAGALLILQATLADERRAEAFWLQAATMMEELVDARGFIRRWSFNDGPHHTLIAQWRTKADADAFFERPSHQEAMRELFRERWQYTHFAGLWEVAAPRRRLVFCAGCDGVTPVADDVCAGCGEPLYDPFDRDRSRA